MSKKGQKPSKGVTAHENNYNNELEQLENELEEINSQIMTYNNNLQTPFGTARNIPHQKVSRIPLITNLISNYVPNELTLRREKVERIESNPEYRALIKRRQELTRNIQRKYEEKDPSSSRQRRINSYHTTSKNPYNYINFGSEYYNEEKNQLTYRINQIPGFKKNKHYIQTRAPLSFEPHIYRRTGLNRFDPNVLEKERKERIEREQARQNQPLTLSNMLSIGRRGGRVTWNNADAAVNAYERQVRNLENQKARRRAAQSARNKKASGPIPRPVRVNNSGNEGNFVNNGAAVGANHPDYERITAHRLAAAARRHNSAAARRHNSAAANGNENNWEALANSLPSPNLSHLRRNYPNGNNENNWSYLEQPSKPSGKLPPKK